MNLKILHAGVISIPVDTKVSEQQVLSSPELRLFWSCMAEVWRSLYCNRPCSQGLRRPWSQGLRRPGPGDDEQAIDTCVCLLRPMSVSRVAESVTCCVSCRFYLSLMSVSQGRGPVVNSTTRGGTTGVGSWDQLLPSIAATTPCRLLQSPPN